MRVIDFFTTYVKPKKLKGTYMLNPTNTSFVSDEISCVREYDVNFWLYKKGDTVISFDSGYKNFKNIENEFEKINANPNNIKAVFITHVDVDHGGGIDKNSVNIFPRANIYIGENDERYLSDTDYRIKKGPIKLFNPIYFNTNYNKVKDEEIIYVDNIKVQAFYTPGHTMGHTCYLVDDKILITGDCLAINSDGGYSFFDFYNMNSRLNINSLINLKDRLKNKKLELICTGHNGYTIDINKAFKNIEIMALSNRAKPFDKTAPYDLFE